MDTSFNYPLVGFHFKVIFHEISGETSFKEVSGLTKEMSYEEIKEGGLQLYKHRLPLEAKYSNLVLKRGLIRSSGLHDWLKACIDDFVFKPITVTVELLNEKHSPLMSWIVKKALPVKWEISNFDSMNSEILLETLELSYDSFTHKKGRGNK